MRYTTSRLILPTPTQLPPCPQLSESVRVEGRAEQLASAVEVRSVRAVRGRGCVFARGRERRRAHCQAYARVEVPDPCFGLPAHGAESGCVQRPCVRPRAPTLLQGPEGCEKLRGQSYGSE